MKYAFRRRYNFLFGGAGAAYFAWVLGGYRRGLEGRKMRTLREPLHDAPAAKRSRTE